jgi:hypothetical protein
VALAGGKVQKYYDNVKLVYEIESRVRDLKRATAPEEETAPKPKPQKQNRSERPRGNEHWNYSLENNRMQWAAVQGVVRREKGIWLNCAKHPEVAAAAYCRTCGRALCEACKRDVRGAIYCEDCLASRVQNPATASGLRASGPNPVLAGLLSLMPFGVAQAYLGQYARGLVYLLVFIGLIWGADNAGPFDFVFGLGIAAFIFFQLFDAVRSARCLQMGQPAPDPFGLDNLLGNAGRPEPAAVSTPPSSGAEVNAVPNTPAEPLQAESHEGRIPVGAFVLICLGVIFLLGNMGMFHFWWLHRLWPVLLIAIGVWMLIPRWDEIASGSARGRRQLMGPAILLVLGTTFLLDQMGHISFGRTWPMVLIVIGLVLFWQRTAPTATRPPMPPSTPSMPPEPPQLGSGATPESDSEQQRR